MVLRECNERCREKLKLVEITVGKSVDEKRKGNKRIESKQ